MATIVITGANRGIGLELARQYAGQGHEVIRTMRGPDKAETPFGVTMALDVTDGDSVAKFAAALDGKAIDLLVNNAGVSGPSRESATDMDFEGFGKVIEANVFGPLRVTQALLPNLRKAGGAKVAVISSRMGSLTLAQGGSVAYRTSKAAVNMAFKLLAGELKSDGIGVVMLHPGWVRTDMGGAGADIDVQTSAAGLIAVMDGLSAANSGRFLDYTGQELPW